MKTCNKNGCNNSIFSHNFCRLHQWMRTDDKYLNYKNNFKKSRQKTAIPKESGKRKKEQVRYLDQIKTFWDESVENGTDFCFFCGRKMLKRDNVHHLRGRDNGLLLDMEWWVNAHNDCHVFKYHFADVETLMREEWYSAFVERLKAKDPLSYKKEIKKQEKYLEM